MRIEGRMSSERDEDPFEAAVKECSVTQCLIDMTAKQLDGLRTQCVTTDAITQKEIREAETKLIKHVSRQLVAKARLKSDLMPDALKDYPKIKQWLAIVGMSEETKKAITERGMNMSNLLEMTDIEMQKIMGRYNATEEETALLLASLKSLKVYTERQLMGEQSPITEFELHWSSHKSANNSPYGGNSPKFSHGQRPSTSSLPADTYLNAISPQSPVTPSLSTPSSPLPVQQSPAESRRRYTPPPTPPLVKPHGKGKFPTTPPPQKRNKLYPDVFHPLTKSPSHESQLSMRVNLDTDMTKYMTTGYTKKKPGNLKLSGSSEAIYKRRKSTESSEAGGSSRGPSGQTSPLVQSPKRSPPYKYLDQMSLPDGVVDMHPGKKHQLFVPPVSPKTPLGSRSMLHQISHRFTNTFKITTCDYCQKQMFLGYKCKECKFQTKLIVGPCDLCKKQIFIGCKACKDCKAKFHRDCASKAAPACGLPDQYVDLVIDMLKDGSPTVLRKGNNIGLLTDSALIRQASSVPAFQVPDSSSNTSSCNSSTPSSPALIMTSCATPPSPAHPSPQVHVTQHESQFTFPDITSTSSTIDSIGSRSILLYSPHHTNKHHPDIVNTNTSNDSDKSDKTLVDSGSTDRTALLDRVDSTESTDDPDRQGWQRVNSISVALKEWDIPFEDIDIDKDHPIGTGRFGTVYRGNWHGDCAIKMLNMDPTRETACQLQAFKMEVAMLRKTRHDNLVLFMGACMKPPDLAIVTSLCKGLTLYTHIHSRKEKLPLNKTVIIASQIAQGMGYLHAKGIVHKDLKSKNIFLETGKVVITDFGLFSITKLCHGNRKGDWLSIPSGWLCYLSPEIIRSLHAGDRHNMDLPFTEASDVFAMGTVWYELLCGEFPYKIQPPESIIWQVGNGVKPSLGHMHASRDVKDVLMQCWSYNTKKRPDFGTLLRTLERVPKKRLARSPSHPIQLSRSAESVF